MRESAEPSGDTDATGDQLAYKIRNAARALDMSERAVATLVATGELESFRIGRSRRIPRDALVAFIERQRAA
jgi:excisionase family DNA binding protein